MRYLTLAEALTIAEAVTGTHLYEGLDEAATDRLEQARNASRADQTRTKRDPEGIEPSTRTPRSLGR